MLGKGPPPTATTQIYETIEEFAAILITNIYRSENLRIGLVRDHLGARPRRGEPPLTPGQQWRDPAEVTRSLGYPLTNPRHFLTFWQEPIRRLNIELNVEHVAFKIANVLCHFNPFRELKLQGLPQAASYAH
jgi:hypothetical protein